MSLTVLEGLRPWVIQRISALVIVAWLIYNVIGLLFVDDVGYQQWREWLYAPANSLFLGLFVLAVLFHAWIGVRDIVLDYVHNVVLRLLLLSAIMVVLIVSGMWSLRILLVPLAA